MAGAVYTALDEPAVQNRERNRRISPTLLAISALTLLGGLLYALAQSIR